MGLIKSKQIDKLLAGWIQVAAFAAAGTSDVVTGVITTALTTAGYGASSVQLTPSATEASEGVVTVGANNRVEIYDSTTKQKIESGSNEVYGRITEAAGVYTLSYYTLVAGVETAYTAASTIDFEFAYRFLFKDYPTDGPISLRSRNVDDDAGGSNGRLFTELLTVSAPNVVSNLTYTPDQTYNVTLFVNGKEEFQLGGTPSFTTVGLVITWSATNAGYALTVNDIVTAKYTTLS